MQNMDLPPKAIVPLYYSSTPTARSLQTTHKSMEDTSPYSRPLTPPSESSHDAPSHPTAPMIPVTQRWLAGPDTPATMHTGSMNVPSFLPTNINGSTSTGPPVQLSQTEWAQETVFKINKLGFNKAAFAPSSKLGERLIEASKVYFYTRIPKHQVRLLLIKHGSFDDPINASLMVVDDQQLGTTPYPYTALSYNWGDKDDDQSIIIQEDPRARPVQTFDALLNTMYNPEERTLKIKPNLHDALRYLRKEREAVAIWVDALCINQKDEREKQEQVTKMALIYRRAYNVNIWLVMDSPSETTSSTAMAFIPLLVDPDNHGKLLKDDSYIKDWASLFELLRWSW
jgi:hypothetical protein